MTEFLTSRTKQPTAGVWMSGPAIAPLPEGTHKIEGTIYIDRTDGVCKIHWPDPCENWGACCDARSCSCWPSSS